MSRKILTEQEINERGLEIQDGEIVYSYPEYGNLEIVQTPNGFIFVDPHPETKDSLDKTLEEAEHKLKKCYNLWTRG